MMTDPIADMLTRIRNAGQAAHKWVDVPVSKMKIEMAKLLQESHFVHGHKVLADGRFGVLRIYLSTMKKDLSSATLNASRVRGDGTTSVKMKFLVLGMVLGWPSSQHQEGWYLIAPLASRV